MHTQMVMVNGLHLYSAFI
uniref:Uncharacterized protein n=1 Tax=Anguilla anguilla TaxID=7936 RepID=A0A0E9XZA3_ANGAN